MAVLPITVLISRAAEGLVSVQPILTPGEFQVVPCPTISICPVPRSDDLDRVLCQLTAFDFVVFTSQAGVVETARHLEALGLDLRTMDRTCICAVGPSTAGLLKHMGVEARVIPNKYTAEALANLFPVMRCHAPRVLFPKSSRASTVIEVELTRKGYVVESPVVYINQPQCSIPDAAIEHFENGTAHCMAFTSPSSVGALKTILGEDRFVRLFQGVTIAAIGSVTTASCVDAGLRVDIQPADYTLPAMAHAIAIYYSRV